MDLPKWQYLEFKSWYIYIYISKDNYLPDNNLITPTILHLLYAVFFSYCTPSFFQYYQLTVTENSSSDYFNSSVWYVLNDVFEQFPEILSFSYFPSLYKYYWTFLM